MHPGDTSAAPLTASPWAATSLRWPLRRYQALALDAYEGAVAQGRNRFYLVMPPGAGKTVAGLEIARRQGRRTLVLCPNTAVQAQWLRQWHDFTPDTLAATADRTLPTPLTVLTYQALCNFHRGDPLDERALALWRETLQSESGISADQADAEIRTLAATGPSHYRAEVARFRRYVRTLTVRGGKRAELLALLHPNGRMLIERMRGCGPWTLVLDECHHLLEMWGYLVRAVVEELGADTFVLGLTATPPAEMAPREAVLYRDLFGHADFEVPTPAVVKEGELAAYQELAYLTRPLPHEADYVAAQHARFERLLERLLEPEFGTRPFLDWISARVEERRARSGAELSWARFERDHPRLAQAALRLLHQTGTELPRGARLGERYRVAPTADDWVVLIEDYCLRYLKVSADPRDAQAWEEIRGALPALGYVLTRQGIRSHRSPVDRVLALSASKGLAALEILDTERQSLGRELRALLLCDYEHAGSEGLKRLRGVLDPRAGSAALLLHLLVGDPGASELQPILMTGRTVACSRATAAELAPWIEKQVPQLRETMETRRLFTSEEPGRNPTWDDIVILRPAHSWWRPRHYVPLLTRYFEEGRSRCLIGTRGLLGEGWDAKRVNVLIDLTTASTRTAVHQMRGRSLRLDPQLPRKVANNWDVVCIDPDHPKGAVDYARFVRKHHHYYAPTAAGEIESGVSHVHPALSPYAPPPAAAFARINTELLQRAGDREAAYALWEIGEPFEGREIHTARIRFERSLGLPNRRLLRRVDAGAGRSAASVLRRRMAGVGAAAVAMGAAGAALGPEIAGVAVGLATAAGGSAWVLRWLRQGIGRLSPSDALEDFAAAVAEALQTTGGISPELGSDSVRLVAQPDGYYRCYLAGASEAESRLFAESLDELLAPLAAPRYLIPRYVAELPRSLFAAGRLLLRLSRERRTGEQVVYHAVPVYLAANRKRVLAFRRAWNRHVSAGEPLYWKDPRAQGILEVQRGEDPFEVTTQMRVLWR